MKLSISIARRQLPALIRRVQRDAGVRVQITVHDEVVAELRAVQPEPEPGAVAAKLLEIMANIFETPWEQRYFISSHVKDHLYGAHSTKRS